ncbi:hypothetical protein MASR2M78_33010 [Treponema sp.]
MKKILLLFFLALSLFVVFPSGAQTTDRTVTQAGPEPYDMSEFPAWAHSLRRSEIVAFGSLPFTVFFSTFVMDSYRYYQNDWDRRFAPWPLKAAGAVQMDEDQRIACFAFGCASAILIGVVDYALVDAKQRRAERAAQEKKVPTIRIDRKDWPPIVELPTVEGP